MLVGGFTAGSIDFSHVLAGKLPLFIGLVVVLSALLLFVMFRSLVIPVQAALMNLLSIGGALGVTVLVFQDGWFASVLGVEKGPIEPWIPVLMFAVVFGLSMDYEVFLVSRVREEWVRRRDASAAVADGIAFTGRVISAAAAIMICVFLSFMLGNERVAQGVRLRPRRGGAARRARRALRAAAGRARAARRDDLVAAALARPASAAHQHRGLERAGGGRAATARGRGARGARAGAGVGLRQSYAAAPTPASVAWASPVLTRSRLACGRVARIGPERADQLRVLARERHPGRAQAIAGGCLQRRCAVLELADDDRSRRQAGSRTSPAHVPGRPPVRRARR